MHGKYYVILATVASRSLPILFGIVVLRCCGPSLYADYVYALNFANALAIAPLLAVCPQILGSKSSRNESEPIAKIAFLFVTIIGLGAVALPLDAIEAGVFGFGLVYSIAAFSSGVTQSLLNRKGRHREVCIQSLAVAAIAVAVAATYPTAVASDTRTAPSLVLFVLPYCVISWFWLLWHVRDIFKGIRIDLLLGGYSHKVLASRATLSAVFGVLLMTGIFLINQSAMKHGSDLERVCVALALQLFGVTVFFPGALGSYFVPKISNLTRFEEKFYRAASLLRPYLIMGGIAWCAIAIALPMILSFYQVPTTRFTMGLVLVFQFAAVLAALNAALTQLCIATASYRILAISAIIWTSVIVFALFGLQVSPLGSAVALTVAYSISSSFVYLSLRSALVHSSRIDM